MLIEEGIKDIYVWEEYSWQPGSNTVLYYSFDNDTASTSYDGAGNNNGTWNGSSGTYVSLSKGKCCQLTSTSGKYMDLPTSISYPTTSFTFSFWVKYTSSSSGNSKAIFSKWNAIGSSGAYLYINELSGKIRADVPYVTDDVFLIDTALNDGVWHLITFTRSGTSWMSYADGVLKRTRSGSESMTGGSATQGRIGANNYQAQVGFSGLLDEFIIEDVARTADKISEYYNGTKENYGL